MDKRFLLLFLAVMPGLSFAHPMGNSSVSHYARFDLKPGAIELTYALDLAELPSSELLRQWGLQKDSPRRDLDSKAVAQAREWSRNLEIAIDGQPVTPTFERSELVISDGAGDLPVVRITSYARLQATSGRLTYEDHNFPDRAGWKEIVIRGGKVAIPNASQGAEDRSKALTEYPVGPNVAPPQDLKAAFEWTAQTAPAQGVVKADFLSRLLHQRELSLSMILIAIAAAFGLGAAHALTPGHGKTIVAAYLVGSRGTLKHAAFLGAMVTFTHTISVFLLGLATLFLFQYIVPEQITKVLGVISGLSIVAIGAWMLYKRLRGVQNHAHSHHHHHEGGDHHHHHEHAHAHAHGHDHEHSHDHHHAHDHDHVHDHGHTHEHVHSHGTLVHSHGPGGHVHSHDVPDEITWTSLVALAVSGGLVPCESALVLLLSAIALGRVGLGLMLLVAFSLGLAIVLMGIGILVIYAKHLLPGSGDRARHPAFRWIPVVSAGVVLFAGLLITGVSLGWLQPKWMI